MRSVRAVLRRLAKRLRRHPRIVRGALAAIAVAAVPRAQTAIVLGALVDADGGLSAMLDDRVTQAARLWHAGKVDRLLVSGDHGRWGL